MNIDKSKIEDIAVNAVNMYISENTTKLESKLVKGDTGISVDGEIVYYSDSSRKVNTYGGTIPVQVKGTIVKHISKEKAAYRHFDLATFKNFLKLNGAMIFLVEEVFFQGKLKEKQIFYKYLDVPSLVEIINDFVKSGNKYKSIHCDKLTYEIDFDEEIEKIRIKRGSVTPGIALYKEKTLRIDTSIQIGFPEYVEIVDGITEEIKKSEFYDDSSEFLKQVIPQIDIYLSKNFVYDHESAVLLAEVFTKNKKYELLSRTTRNKVLIFLAKVCNYRMEYDKANIFLDEIDQADEINEYFYNREKFIAACSTTTSEESNIIFNRWANGDDAILYELFFEIKTNRISIRELEKIEKTADNEDLFFLLGLGYSNLGEPLKASELFEKVHGNSNAQILKIINYFRGVINEVLLENNLSFIDQLAIYKDELNNYLKDLESKNLTLLQGNYIYNLLTSVVKPEEYFNKELGNIMEEDIFIIQAKLLTENYDAVISYISSLNNIDQTMMFLLMVAYTRKNDTAGLLSEIENQFKQTNDKDEKKAMLLEDFYVESLVKLKDIKRINLYLSSNRKKINNIHLLRLLLVKLTEIKQLNKEEHELLKQLIIDFKDIKKISLLNEIVFNFEDIELTKFYWEHMKNVHADLIVEVVCTKLLKNGEQSNLLYLLNVITWYSRLENTKISIIPYELQAYYLLEQYKAIINRVNKIETPDDEAQNLRLISKIKIKDYSDIEKILESALNSKNHDLVLNAGLGYISFDIDVLLGSKILLREIIESNFRNIEIGKNFVMQRFSGMKNYKEKEFSRVSGKQLYYFELACGEEKLEIITIPTSWEYPENGEVLSLRIDDREYFILAQSKIGSSIKRRKKIYTITKKMFLSSYVHNRMWNEINVSSDSDRFIKTFNIEKDDISEVVKFMEENNKVKADILEKMQTYGLSGFVGYLCSNEELFGCFRSLFNDTNFRYQLGRIEQVTLEDSFQLSISSLALLANYGLQDILSEVSSLFVDREINKLINQAITIELDQGYEMKKIGVYNGQPYITERTEKEYNDYLDFLNLLLEILEKIPNQNESTFVQPELNKVLNYDSYSLQSALDNVYGFFIEDGFFRQFSNCASVLSVVHEIMMHTSPDIDRYLSLLIRLEEDNNDYFFADAEMIIEVYSVVCKNGDIKIKEKFDKWFSLRSENNAKTKMNNN